jgi:carbonic anhydrase
MENDAREFDRASFLRRASVTIGAAGSAALGLGKIAEAAGGGPPMEASTPAEALAKLKEGNHRFASGKPQCLPLTARVAELSHGQNPFAIVLGCSDSRVPVETIFDQVPGNIFVVRVAGNFLTNDGLGSIEYSVANLHSKLILVLGHSNCGAVSAAVAYVKSGTSQPGHIQDLVTAIEPAAEATKDMHGDWVANAVAENVARNAAALTHRSSIVAEAAKSGSLRVAGAVYDLHTGRVNF